MTTELETTREDVATLLENFKEYVNPAGDEDPGFTLAEINQQFAWEDIPHVILREWLTDLSLAGLVQKFEGDEEPEWRWVY